MNTHIHLSAEASKYFNSQKDTKTAWIKCEDGIHLLELVDNFSIDKKLLSLVKGNIARIVIHLIYDESRKKEIKAAIAFGIGKITEKKLRKIYRATGFFRSSMYADSAADDAADINCNTFMVGMNVINAVCNAALKSGNDYTDIERKTRQDIADICRKYLTDAVFEIIDNIRSL